jgi:hypothetical protein
LASLAALSCQSDSQSATGPEFSIQCTLGCQAQGITITRSPNWPNPTIFRPLVGGQLPFIIQNQGEAATTVTVAVRAGATGAITIIAPYQSPNSVTLAPGQKANLIGYYGNPSMSGTGRAYMSGGGSQAFYDVVITR